LRKKPLRCAEATRPERRGAWSGKPSAAARPCLATDVSRNETFPPFVPATTGVYEEEGAKNKGQDKSARDHEGDRDKAQDKHHTEKPQDNKTQHAAGDYDEEPHDEEAPTHKTEDGALEQEADVKGEDFHVKAARPQGALISRNTQMSEQPQQKEEHHDEEEEEQEGDGDDADDPHDDTHDVHQPKGADVHQAKRAAHRQQVQNNKRQRLDQRGREGVCLDEAEDGEVQAMRLKEGIHDGGAEDGNKGGLQDDADTAHEDDTRTALKEHAHTAHVAEVQGVTDEKSTEEKDAENEGEDKDEAVGKDEDNDLIGKDDDKDFIGGDNEGRDTQKEGSISLKKKKEKKKGEARSLVDNLPAGFLKMDRGDRGDKSNVSSPAVASGEPTALPGPDAAARHSVGRAASSGALAPEPPRATRSQPEAYGFAPKSFFSPNSFFLSKNPG